MRAAALLLAAVTIVGGALPGGAAAQVEPDAPAGARQTAHVERDFDSYDLPVGSFGLNERAVRTVEGAIARSAWRLDDSQASVAGVMQGYRERLGALGFAPIFACAGEVCGGFDFRFGAEILPPPGMLVDVRDFAQLTTGRDDPEGYVSVLVSRVLDTIHVQTVSVMPAKAEPAAPPDEAAEVPAVEEAPGTAAEAEPEWEPETASATVTPPPDERTLLARLTEDGHVPVQGLDFEVGGAGLSDGSTGALDLLASMLEDEDMPVAIVGHSDNQGGLELNIDLSRRRAEAVMQALIDRGVPPSQLEARGVGYLAPVASNATEEGRARNRRVELVLR